MHLLKRCLVASILGSTMVGLAPAQVAKKPAEPLRELFLDLDANHDNAIEREEVPASGRPAFERLLRSGDNNHNGKLEAEEYRSVLLDLRTFSERAKQKAVDRFRSMDKDGDSKLSREEFTGPKPRFDLLDRNGDGFLTEQEFLAAAQGKAVAKQAQAKKKGESPKPAEGPKPAVRVKKDD